MSLYDYQACKRIWVTDPPFAAVIMAAYRAADTANEAKLRAAWPDICAETKYRYWSGCGLMPGEPGYDATYDDNLPIQDGAS